VVLEQEQQEEEQGLSPSFIPLRTAKVVVEGEVEGGVTLAMAA
jgi:hypothetical protein